MREQNRHSNEDINKGCGSIFNDPLAPLVWNRFYFVLAAELYLQDPCFLPCEGLVKAVLLAQAKCCIKPAYTWLFVCEWDTERDAVFSVYIWKIILKYECKGGEREGRKNGSWTKFSLESNIWEECGEVRTKSKHWVCCRCFIVHL